MPNPLISRNDSRSNSRDGWRSVFVSDLHLGCRHAAPARFLRFLESECFTGRRAPEHLYLVGDIIDGWRLRRRWRWTADDRAILERLMELAARGVSVHYCPGNHDHFARDLAHRFGPVEIAEEFLHVTADGRRLLVMHGDQVDRLEEHAPWLSEVLCRAHDYVLYAASALDRVRRFLRQSPRPFNDSLHQLGKRFAGVITNFERRLADCARSRGAGGVVCGHIHTPCLRNIDDVLYCNTGDWIRHFSALVEHRDGSLELLRDLGAQGPPALIRVDPDGERSHSMPRFTAPAFAYETDEPAVALATSCVGH